MFVWWMLRDMTGDAAMKKALASYHADDDKDPSYMPRLVEAQSEKDLRWFFDDWVLNDPGLPDFRVQQADKQASETKTYLTTITIENTGAVGAEVPVIVRMKVGEIVKRVIVRAKAKSVIRVETPSAPVEVVVNDGSVPESDMSNNSFKLADEVK
jgi:aminopeptidase N